ncbi:hypothetical protein [Crossiella sp. S99.2]|uniref:hypothetical protein n=1 Tax=Crossiella sp. S99.2 TaxID=2936272 RepID=UPI001FFFC024|nr:hypothetical protein [Crossiella sp. S99.2]MCK2238066.1 hypothetical protein [Crossiella sp. S99.2]
MERHRHPDTAVPAYGSPAWHALPQHHPHRVRATVLAAEAWHRYWSPPMLRLRAEQTERDFRARLRAVGYDVAAAWADQHVILGPSYRALTARRTLRTTTSCGRPGCAEPVTVAHPFPARWLDAEGWPNKELVRCPAHDAHTTPNQNPESGVPQHQASAVRPSTGTSAPHLPSTSRPDRARPAAEGTAA